LRILARDIPWTPVDLKATSPAIGEVAVMDNEINDLHKQIKNLMNGKVGAKGGDQDGGPRRMAASERQMLLKARRACGPYAGSEWRKAAI
jgi:hypothetical protein